MQLAEAECLGDRFPVKMRLKAIQAEAQLDGVLRMAEEQGIYRLRPEEAASLAAQTERVLGSLCTVIRQAA